MDKDGRKEKENDERRGRKQEGLVECEGGEERKGEG